MSFSTRMADRALRLLTKYGQPMLLTRTITGVYDPDTCTTGAPVVTTHKCKGFTQFITRTSANQFYGTSVLQETLIQKDDEMCFVAAKGLLIVPQSPTDTLTIGSKVYNVMFNTPLHTQGADILYVLQIRK